MAVCGVRARASSSASRPPRRRRCVRRRSRPLAARLGGPVALRPLAGRAHRRRARGARSPAAPARAGRCSGGGRGEAVPARARAARARLGAGRGGAAHAALARRSRRASRCVRARSPSLAPRGVWDSSRGQLSRPLQIESLGSALLLDVRPPAGRSRRHGSQNLVGARTRSPRLRRVLQALARRRRSGSPSRAGPATRGAARPLLAPPRSARSSRSARCSRRSS